MKGGEIQAAIVASLRASGIDVIDVNQDTLLRPCLFVNANILKRRDGSVVYEVSVSLNQEVTIASSGRSYMAPTWSASTLAFAAGSDTSKFVRSDINGLADRFIRAYLNVHTR